MSQSGPTDARIQELLLVVTDSLLADEHDVDSILRYYNVPRSQVSSLLYVIERLREALTVVKPNRRFVQRLKVDLVGEPEPTVFNRIRYLPPRVQIAAGVALLAGVMFVARRRFTVDTSDGVAAEGAHVAR